MNPRIRPFLTGMGSALLAMGLYGIALSCYNALMLLLVSMEEGGQGLTDFSVPLTKAVILYSQGVGLQYPPLTLTIMPLGLTVLLIVLIRACALRLGCSWQGYVAGLASWLAVHGWIASTSSVGTLDSMAVIELKTAVVFSIGYLIALIPRTGLPSLVSDSVGRLDQPFRRTLRQVPTALVIIAATFTLASLITVIVWAVLGWNDMTDMFPAIGMERGSAIMTTIAYLIWLPNLMLWALSWVFGGGFSIGSLASFSLWSGSGYSLPSLPLFALFPAPVGQDSVRITLMVLPGALTFVIGMWMMLSPKRFNALGRNEDEDPAALVSRTMIWRFAHPAMAFVAVIVVMSVVLPLLMTISNGSLGSGELAHIGVDVADSTRALVRPSALGFLAAWLVPLIIVCARYGIRTLIARRGSAGTSAANVGTAKDGTTSGTDGTASDIDVMSDIGNMTDTASAAADRETGAESFGNGPTSSDHLVPRTVQSGAPSTVDSKLPSETARRARVVSSDGIVDNPTIKEDK
ncbi:DUF6350 family protein [Bifidobacterium simiarum]|nr:DUF6350 family protein [Bifidobacterium simiarum]